MRGLQSAAGPQPGATRSAVDADRFDSPRSRSLLPAQRRARRAHREEPRSWATAPPPRFLDASAATRVEATHRNRESKPRIETGH
ncbi:hypothetical protein WT60_07975 [Burkholderia sp. MSMB617WGS]|nr:hypothetical protein WT60_07975 [Burkholderia sp. MSMB617WGS]